jgi:endonuclease YncB( thermonuclease family)
MPQYPNYPIPHLLGKVNYPAGTKLRPDGDTIHLFDPVLLLNGKAIQPANGQFKVWVTGAPTPKTIHLSGKPGSYHVPIRFEGIDAPEEHYRANPFSLTVNGQPLNFIANLTVKHEERSQPMWKPATDHAVDTLQKAGWALVMLDREVTDRYKRVLGYVYSSNANGVRKKFLSLELLKLGLAYPFLFESAGSLIPTFLQAASQAKQSNLGVWKHYHHKPLSFAQTYSPPKHYTDPEPPSQQNGKLNLPVVFRRTVDTHQLQGLSLQLALQKYDAMDYTTGKLVSGDKYHTIPVEKLIWAPHSFS